MNSYDVDKFNELVEKHGLCPDGDLLEFGEVVVKECIKVCKTIAEDVANGDIFLTEKSLLEDLKNGRWESLMKYTGNEIKKHFNGWQAVYECI